MKGRKWYSLIKGVTTFHYREVNVSVTIYENKRDETRGYCDITW